MSAILAVIGVIALMALSGGDDKEPETDVVFPTSVTEAEAEMGGTLSGW